MPDIVLVTGASGFLGGWLVSKLLESSGNASIVVRVLLRRGTDLSQLRFDASHANVEIAFGHLENRESLIEALRPRDPLGAPVRVVYHCAAATGDWGRLSFFQSANVIGLNNLLQAIDPTMLKRFVHVSTVDVYGYPRKARLCNESDATRICDVHMPYNTTKIAAERLVLDAHSKRGIPITIVRPSNIFGPGDFHFIGGLCAHLARSSWLPLIRGGVSRSGFCYVENLCCDIIRAGTSQRTLGRIYNLHDGFGETYREFALLVSQALATQQQIAKPRPTRIVSLPFWPFWALGWVYETIWKLLGRFDTSPRITRQTVLQFGYDQDFPIDAALQDGVIADLRISLQEGIQRSVQWWLSTQSTKN